MAGGSFSFNWSTVTVGTDEPGSEVESKLGSETVDFESESLNRLNMAFLESVLCKSSEWLSPEMFLDLSFSAQQKIRG